jgi:myo-inositol 2-dehydrogenase / D-chiro-inositol 1-dehydrogenase
MKSDTLRVGLVGTGFMGKAHAESYLQSGAEISMVASRSEANARAAAERYGARTWTTDYRELVASDIVDAVDITVPNHLHRDVALAAIDAGTPFLVEKPLARNLAEAEEILAAAREHGVIGVYAENMRFSPALEQTKSIIDQGGIGRPILFRATEIHNGPFHADWFWDAETAGGGAVIDMGIHGLYVAEWLMGARVTRVYAELGTLKWTEHCRPGTEDSAFVTLRFDNGAIGELLNSWAVAGGRDVRAEIYGTAGTVHVDKARGETGLLAYSQEGYGPPIEVEAALRPHVTTNRGWHFPGADPWHQHGHAYAVRHFVEVVREGAAPRCTLEEGRRALELVEAVYRSGREGRAVDLTQSV